jgi:CubicO group peptidase (beta-lactamase class C family)
MTTPPSLALSVAVAAAVLLAACGDSDGPTDPDPGPDTSSIPATLSLSGAPGSLVVGDTFQVTATVRNDRGTALPAASVHWTTPDGDRLESLSSGRFRSIGAGEARIVATSGNVSDTLAVAADPRVATSISAGLSSLLFLTGDEEHPQVQVRDQRNRIMEGPDVVWEASDPEVLGVTPAGAIQGRAPGTAHLTAGVADAGAEGPEASLEIRVFPGSGPRVPELVVVDSAVVAWMEAFSVPGTQVAVMHEGRLVLSRGYGVQSVDRSDPVREENLFRIGSLSKPLTGLAFLQIVEGGMATLDDRPFAVLVDHYTPLPGGAIDHRLLSVTARDILRHQTGHGNREVDQVAWRAVWQHGETEIDRIYRYALGHPLDHDPRTVYQYTNFNTKTIARYMEVLTGTDIESHMRAAFMAPAGVERMAFGRSALHERDPMEVRYHDETGALTALMDADDHVMVHWDASGAWIGSATDVLRVVRAALEGTPDTPAFLSAETRAEISTRNPDVSGSANFFMGLHWSINLSGPAPVWSHTGAARGAWAGLSYDHRGIAWALLSNRHSAGELGFQLGPYLEGVDWPEHDLFER